MDTFIHEKFYNMLKEGKRYETALSLRDMLKELPDYLQSRLEKRYIPNHEPFVYIYPSKRVLSFGSCIIKENGFAIRIIFDNNGYTVFFFEQSLSEHNSEEVFDIRAYFKDISILHDFSYENDKKYCLQKHYGVFDEDKVIQFIDHMFIELKRYINK